MQHVIDETLKAISREFINATNQIISVYEKFPNNFKLQDEFSMVLMRIFQGFMWENFSSAQLLAANKKFFSFSILCRSTLDIIIQLTWILSQESPKKERAIKLFLDFDGVCITNNGKKKYEWQYSIDPNYSMRKWAIEVKLDREILSWGTNLDTEKNDKNLNLTVVDYLSKVSHWNPRFLHELIGVNKEKHLGYTIEYLRMCIISLNTFISCAVMFAEIFCSHFFEDKNNDLAKLQEIRSNFVQIFEKLLNETQAQPTQEFPG